MMQFYKYHGAGNDFIIFNFLEKEIDISEEKRKQLCNRHTGIGADGVMYLLPSKKYHFEMKYFNADGKEGSMCGNGGRCMISFAYDMGLIEDNYNFYAVDGEHSGHILEINDKEKIIELQMADVSDVKEIKGQMILNTGSPHYVDFRDEISQMNVYEEGKIIRNSVSFKKEGINVNFVEIDGDRLKVRTYERGVENETLACGTGVTAAAIAASIKQNGKFQNYVIQTLGGKLRVRFRFGNDRKFSQIFLTGPASFVYTGVWEH